MSRRSRTTIDVRRAADRYFAEQPGIQTWHSFSAGAHYDPDNVAFGALVGVDEHHVSPGAGFPAHRHRDVEIVSYVVRGTLRHEIDGRRTEVAAGELLHQSAGGGIEHVEANASDDEPLVLIQMTLSGAGRAGAPGEVELLRPEVAVVGTAGLFVAEPPLIIEARRAYLHVLRGTVTVEKMLLEAGDAARVTRTAFNVRGDGQLLCWLQAT